ncbi:MAG: polymerase, sigma-24 subunit, subfamily [Mycobacterium sp.]|jgi:RNA polymerase sigma factor (sigma-70 family)|nr:polymerase, sigma-24 subunit, subfamily [Mycobacterium sp.]
MSRGVAASPLSDAELTRAAQSGNAGSLAVLLARHEAGMRAVALGIIGYGPDTDDVVQDAALVAVRRITDVRNPAAVGPWLRAVVRNECRMWLRSRRVGDRGGDMLSALPSEDPMPEELMERQLLQDWVWHAIEELSPSLRVVAMLRYFSDVSSYEQIAAVCELPIGTVRSRLSQARVKLTEGLSATAEHVHDNASAKHEICRQDALDTLAAANRGAFSEFTSRLSPHLEVIQPHGDRGGANLLLTNLRAEHEKSTHRRPVNVVVGGDVVIWETELIDSSNKPTGGPSAAAWVMSLDPNGLVRQMRLFELRTPV